MAKLTKFKAQQVEFGTHYKIEETNRGDTKIKSITPAFGNIREPGTPETEEIYNGLQLGNVHTLQAIKSTNLNIDYYICNLDGLTEFGLNNDLKIRITVDNANTNTTTKLRLNNIDYTLLKEYNGNLKQIEAGDFKPNKTYELTYNGSQFIVINVDSRLNEIMGLEFGGNIQDTGDKVRGKCYFDNVTKFYYECIEDNSLTYNDSGKFRAISNKPISDKVENLPRFYAKTTNIYFLNDRFTIKIPKSNFIFGILAVSHKTYGWRNKIIFTEGESCFEHVSSASSQRLVITTDSQNVYLSSQDRNISLFLINSVTFFYYD